MERDLILKKYEAVFILDIRKVDDEGEAFVKEFTGLIEKLGGVFVKSVPMGRKQFSYEIAKRRAGIYLNFFFELPADKVIGIRDAYKLDERVLRNMVIVDERPENMVCMTTVKLEGEER